MKKGMRLKAERLKAEKLKAEKLKAESRANSRNGNGLCTSLSAWVTRALATRAPVTISVSRWSSFWLVITGLL
jgi:hypothetical protein